MDPKNLEMPAEQSNMVEKSVEPSRKRRNDDLLDEMNELNRMRAELYAERQKSKWLGDRLDSTMEKLVDSQRDNAALSQTVELLRTEVESLKGERDEFRRQVSKMKQIVEDLLKSPSSDEEDSSDDDDGLESLSDGLSDTIGDVPEAADQRLTIDESGTGAKLSTGIGSLDAILGDALSKTSFAVIDDCTSQSYADILLKHFISEAIFRNQDVLLIDVSGNPSLLDSLPSRIEMRTDGQDNSPGGTGSDNSPDGIGSDNSSGGTGSDNSPNGSSYYDLEKPIEDQSLIHARCRTYPPADVEAMTYKNVLNYLLELLSSDAYSKSGPKKVANKKKNPLRIVIRELDGAKWSDPENLLKFFALLLRKLRLSYDVVVIASTSASSPLPRETKHKMAAYSDLFIRLTEISTQEKQENSGLDKYHGFVHIVKPSHLQPVSADLVFEAHRKSFDVKTLHHRRSPAHGDEDDEEEEEVVLN